MTAPQGRPDYFVGKTIKLDGKTVKVDDRQARAIYQYLVRNNYVDEQDNITQDYRDDVQAGTLAPVPETLKPIEEGVHTLVQAIYDETMLKSMFEDGNKPKVLENPLTTGLKKQSSRNSGRPSTTNTPIRWILF